jgi:hypothetical protein
LFFNADQHAPMKLYSLKIWDDGTLVRDFVPCTDENGKPGLYDTVNGQMYYNMAGGEDFLFGYEGAPCNLSCAQTATRTSCRRGSSSSRGRRASAVRRPSG